MESKIAVEIVRRLSVGNVMAGIRKLRARARGFVYLHPGMAAIIIVAFSFFAAERAFAQDYYATIPAQNNKGESQWNSGAVITKNGTGFLNYPQWWNRPFYGESLGLFPVGFDGSYIYLASTYNFYCANSGNSMTAWNSIYRTSVQNPSAVVRTDLFQPSSGMGTGCYDGAQSYAGPNINIITMTRRPSSMLELDSSEDRIYGMSAILRTGVGFVWSKSFSTGIERSNLISSSRANTDGFSGLFLCGTTNCSQVGVVNLGKEIPGIKEGYSCFPTMGSALYTGNGTHLFGWAVSCFPDNGIGKTEIHSYGGSIGNNNPGLNGNSNSEMIFSGATLESGEIYVCEGGFVKKTQSYYGIDDTDNTPQNFGKLGLLSTGKSCYDIFKDDIGGVATVSNTGVVVKSNGITYNLPAGLDYLNIAFSTDSAEPVPPPACSTSTVSTSASFSKTNLGTGTWTDGNTLTFTGNTRIRFENAFSTGSTNPESLGVSLVENGASASVLKGSIPFNAVRLTFSGASILNGVPFLNTPDSWPPLAYNSTQQLFAGSGPFVWTNSNWEVPFLEKVEIGTLSYETATTQTCVAADGTVTTTTSTGAYVPGGTSTGSVSGSGVVSIPDIDTGNPILDAIANELIGPLKDLIEPAFVNAVGYVVPFHGTPDLAVMMPVFSIKPGTTAMLDFSIGTKSVEFMTPENARALGANALINMEGSGSETTGVVRKFVSVILSFIFLVGVVAAISSIYLPIVLAQRLAKGAGRLTESLGLSQSAGGITSVPLMIAYWAVIIGIFGATLGLWGAVVLNFLLPAFDFIRPAISFVALWFGDYEFFAIVTNGLFIAVPAGAVAIITFRFLASRT